MSAAPHIPSELVLRIASYFTPIHHVAGRLRVRVSSDIKKEADSLPLEKIDQTIKQIDGIKNVKFNKLIGSATIEYDHEIFPKKMWDDLLKGQNLHEISVLINNLAQKATGGAR